MDADYERGKARIKRTSNAVQHMRARLLPATGRETTEQIIDAYAMAVWGIQNHCSPAKVSDLHTAQELFMAFVLAVSPLGVNGAFIEEFWAPYLEFTVDENIFTSGVSLVLMATRFEELPEGARATLLRTLGRYAPLPWLKPDIRTILCEAIHRFISGAQKDNPQPGLQARWMLKRGMVAPAVRALAQPLPEGLNAA